MRPVNLIPSETRSGGGARTAPIAYLLVGALAIGLGVVTLLVLTNNKIADRQATIADLSREQQAEQAKAAQLQPFISFQETESQRIKAIRDIANGRTDWNRIMQELSRILPDDVRLDALTASAGGSDETGTTAAPSLSMGGCAMGHEGVAGFIAALQDIDGVTRVDLQNSEKAGVGTQGTLGTVSDTVGESSCPPSADVAKFTLTASLESATAAPASAAPSVAAAPATSTTPAPTSDTAQATPASAPANAIGSG